MILGKNMSRDWRKVEFGINLKVNDCQVFDRLIAGHCKWSIRASPHWLSNGTICSLGWSECFSCKGSSKMSKAITDL